MQQTAQIIEMDEVKDVEFKALALPEQARGIKVIDNPTMEKANGLLMDIRSIRKEISDTFKPLAEKAHAAHKAILEQQKRTEAPLIEAEGILKTQIRAYMDEVERLRREEERRQPKATQRKRRPSSKSPHTSPCPRSRPTSRRWITGCFVRSGNSG